MPGSSRVSRPPAAVLPGANAAAGGGQQTPRRGVGVSHRKAFPPRSALCSVLDIVYSAGDYSWQLQGDIGKSRFFKLRENNDFLFFTCIGK